MTIFLDPQIFYLQKYGGISRLFAEFWKICNERDDVEIICPLFYSENLHLREYNLQPKTLNFLFDKNYFGKKYFNAIQKRLNKYKASYYLKNKKYDVFVCTYYNPYFLNSLHHKPFVLTVFDMIHEIFPQYFPAEELLKKNKKELCEKSNKIVAISTSTKNDIVKFYPNILSNKIEVIHLSQSIVEDEIISSKWLPKEYVLFVGKREIYKQYATLLEAMIPILKTNKNLKLVCAGGGSFTEEENEYLKSLDLTNRVIQHHFFDDELYNIYHNAKLFVFPSEYEGFGIPTLEAMSCGCPVILSKTSSLPEIGEDAALYFEPKNIEQLSTAINTILEDETQRNLLIQKGYRQAAKFSWQKMTTEYLTLIKNITKQ